MRRLNHIFTDKAHRLENWVVLLSGLWLFLLPFGRTSQAPVVLLAGIGLSLLIRTKGRCACNAAAKGFLLLIALYLIPIALSLTGACALPNGPEIKYPLRVLLIGMGSGLAGLAVITATKKQETLQRIMMILAAVIGFWILDAGIQAVFGYDIFGQSRGERLSGPFTKKVIMGYFAGPYSALLLIFVLQKKWKPIWLWAIFIFTSIIIMLNNSRGGWVMYALVAAVFLWQMLIAHQKHKLLACTGMVILGLTMLSGLYFASSSFRDRADQTLIGLSGNKEDINDALSDRLPIWEAAWGIIQDYPITGVGARNLRNVALDYWVAEEGKPIKLGNTFYSHQLLLEYAVGTGAIGLTGLAFSFWLCFHWWRRATIQQRRLAAGYGLALLALYFPLNTHRAIFGSLTAISRWMLITLYVASILHHDEGLDVEGSGQIKTT